MSCQQNLAQAIANAASAQGVPVDFVLSIAQRESGTCHWNTDGSVKVSSAGAIGIMQLMPSWG
jgi:soluble lytic murein transglycosylase-like protein